MERLTSFEDLEHLRQSRSKDTNAGITLSLCGGTGCRANDSQRVFEALQAQLAKTPAGKKVVLRRTGCLGFCEKGPILIMYPSQICYVSVKPEDAEEIAAQALSGGPAIERLLWKNGRQTARTHGDIPFYKFQTRRLLADSVRIDPFSIEDYVDCGGYGAWAKTLKSMSAEDVVAEIKKSGLRGRGGGGFSTATKWEAARAQQEAVKYVVVNGDEGDPGAYMDRSLLEGSPHSVLEGLLIGAYAIGAHEAFFYIRQEYPLALQTVRQAISQAQALGLTGDNILGSGFSCTVKIHQGAGAFVSGESSALLSAIEGKVGEPRLKYIRMSESGLWGKPTVLNNVETWANVPLIIKNGAHWFAGIGTKGNTGTKIFSLVGKVENTGLVEVPMGITLRGIIDDIGGGIKDGKKFKAVQTGGPSGGCLPESHLDLPVDFDSLTEAGSMMGSGGMIVMDEDSCMVDVARYFVSFLLEESCGKCMPCREGIGEMAAILDRITHGGGALEDLDFLEDIALMLSEASLCGLGSSAANPVLSTLKHFKHEYIAHIEQKTCAALACKAFIAYSIDPSRCKACGLCKKQCPAGAIAGESVKTPYRIIADKCIKCGVCLTACPKKFSAITKISPAGATAQPKEPQ